MDAVGHVEAGLFRRIFFVLVGIHDPALDLPHAALCVDGFRAEGFCQREALVAHDLQVAFLRLVGRNGGDGICADNRARTVRLALLDDGAKAVQVGFFVSVIGLGTPADVVDAESNRHHGRVVAEHVSLQPRDRTAGGVAAFTRVEKADPGGPENASRYKAPQSWYSFAPR